MRNWLERVCFMLINSLRVVKPLCAASRNPSNYSNWCLKTGAQSSSIYRCPAGQITDRCIRSCGWKIKIPHGPQYKFSDQEARAFVLSATALSTSVFNIAFWYGVFKTVFFEHLFYIWVTSSVALAASMLVPPLNARPRLSPGVDASS